MKKSDVRFENVDLRTWNSHLATLVQWYMTISNPKSWVALFFSAMVYHRVVTKFYLFLFAVPSGYPRITESPTLKAVEKDRNTVMLCSATGNPDPTITWLKDFIPVDLTDPRLKLLDTGKEYVVLFCFQLTDKRK